MDTYIHDYPVKRRYSVTSKIFQAESTVPCNSSVEMFRMLDSKVIVLSLSTKFLLSIIRNLLDVSLIVILHYISLTLLLFIGNLVDISFCIDLQSLMLQAVFFMNGGQCSGIYSLRGTSCKTRRSYLTVRCVYGLICVPCISFIMFFSILDASKAWMWMLTSAFLMHCALFAFFPHFAT